VYIQFVAIMLVSLGQLALSFTNWRVINCLLPASHVASSAFGLGRIHLRVFSSVACIISDLHPRSKCKMTGIAVVNDV